MKEPHKLIFQIYDNAKELLSDQSIAFDPVQLKNVASCIYSPGPSIRAIFDFPSRSFDKVSQSVEELLGYPASNFTVEKLISIIHPEDIGLVIKNEALAGVFLHKFLSVEERPFYKATYQYRVKDSDDNYRLFLHQAVPLTLDSNGLLSKTLVCISDISKYGDKGNRYVSFIDIRGIKSYANIDVEADLMKKVHNEKVLTKREIEILQLISEGYNSKQIAETLFISYDTVRTHRNNIISKNNFNSINQAVAYYIRNGLL